MISAGIHMSDIPAFPYEILWGERSLGSVANLTRARRRGVPGAGAARSRCGPRSRSYPLASANEALDVDPQRPPARRRRARCRLRRRRLAEEVLVAGAAQGGGAGAVLGGDEALEAADDRRRDAARLVADQVGGAGRLVGDRDQGRLQLAAAGVGAAAPVVERREAGAADRDLGLAQPPGAAEAVGDRRPPTRRRAAAAISARMRRAEASGSSGSRQTVSGSGRLEVSMPALAQTKPWRVSTIRTPRSARSTSRLSSRISSTRAGSLPSTAASRRASAPGIDRGEPAHPALRLGDDLLRDRRRRRRPRARRGRRSARRARIPSPTSGRPATGSDPQPALAHIPSALAVRAAAAAVAPSSSRVRATTSAGVSRSRPSEASSSTAKGTPASRAAATWRAQLPSPKAGRIASGGREDQGVGAGRRGGRGRSPT